jgi:glycosyltransferase involved in cell wall biosynthesis
VPAPEISVVVPVRNGARSLPRLLSGLERQTFPRERFEVVVVDNGSRDDGAGVAHAWGANVVVLEHGNRAAARNAGAQAAQAPLLAFTDADCEPEPEWLEALRECLDASRFVAGAVVLQHGEPPNRVERFDALWRFAQERYVPHGYAATANVGIHRDAFETVNGFDPGFRKIGEDVDFGLRVKASGVAIAYCPRARVRHAISANLREAVSRAIVHGYSSTQLARRHGSEYGRVYWRHPRPAFSGDWAVRRTGVDPRAPEADGLLAVARAEYAGRILGSLWAVARRAN